jgi:phosphate transport system substrate-binding protein
LRITCLLSRIGVTPACGVANALRRRPAYTCALALLIGFGGANLVVRAENLRIGGSGATLGTMQLLAREFSVVHPEDSVTILPSLGSSGGIRAVLDGSIGLASISRELEERERTRGAVAIEYAQTPFVFAVSAESRVTAVTTRELGDIYSGRMVAWADGSRIRIVLRPSNDIDTETIKNISPGIRQGVIEAQARPGVRVAVNDQDAAADIEKIAGAIGPSTLALILSEKRPLRALTLDGTEPTVMNMATGTYPLSKRLFLVTGVRRPAVVERFIRFVQSPAGQKILTGNGQLVP